jgi:hypothetical protein
MTENQKLRLREIANGVGDYINELDDIIGKLSSRKRIGSRLQKEVDQLEEIKSSLDQAATDLDDLSE